MESMGITLNLSPDTIVKVLTFAQHIQRLFPEPCHNGSLDIELDGGRMTVAVSGCTWSDPAPFHVTRVRVMANTKVSVE